MTTMTSGIIEVDGIATQIQTLGGWVDEEVPEDTVIIVVIPGNPGIIHYYTEFMETLYDNLKSVRNIRIWGVSHAGHTVLPKAIPFSNVPGSPTMYGYQNQLQHKASFLRSYLPRGCKAILIGHSIGCKIIVDLLKEKKLESCIQMGYLLFPTIERMKDTPNGKWLTRWVNHFWWFLLFLCNLLSLIPSSVADSLIKWYFRNDDVLPSTLPATRHLFDRRTMKASLYMGYTEMMQVNDLDVDVIQKNTSRLKMYYGRTDNWCPLSYYNGIKERIPGVDAVLCSRGYQHAFVLRNSYGMAELVTKWILKLIRK